MEKAIFAAGCFWGVQHYLDRVPGVIKTTVGYTGGHKENPVYEEVKSQLTGHAEVVEVEFDPVLVTFEELCKLFFEIHDPGQQNGQGPDIGPQYRSEIFYTNDKQRVVAENSYKSSGQRPRRAYGTTPADRFWPAENTTSITKTGDNPYCHFRIKILVHMADENHFLHEQGQQGPASSNKVLKNIFCRFYGQDYDRPERIRIHVVESHCGGQNIQGSSLGAGHTVGLLERAVPGRFQNGDGRSTRRRLRWRNCWKSTTVNMQFTEPWTRADERSD